MFRLEAQMKNKKPFQLEQVAIRLVEAPPLQSDYPLNSPDAVVKLMAETLKDYDREVFAVVNLRPDLKPINMNIVSMGALDQSLVHPREALKSMVLSNACSVLMVHNHTSGKLVPSKEDIAVTDRMAKVCSMVGIKLLDHVIVGPGQNYYSFHKKQVLPLPHITYAKDLSELEIGGNKVAETKLKATKAKRKSTKNVVTFTVAECGEFHNLGEYHEDILTAKEAIDLFKKIPPERMHGIPAIGIRVTDEHNSEIPTEIDVFSENRLDLDILKYVPEIKENDNARQGIAQLMHAFLDAEIIGDVPEKIHKKLQVIETKEKQADQLKNITDKLEKGVQEIFDSGKYKNLLDTMAKFPRYSINNSILIMLQKPEAQLCQSFTGWKKMNRFVKKGEKGIKILAPAPYTIQKEQNKLADKTGHPIVDRDGEPVKETVEVSITAFKVVNTFDISQTDGQELPSLGVNELVGSIEGYGALFEALRKSCPVPITFEEVPGEAKGFYHIEEKRIAIQEGMSEVQNVKTTIHEMAHQKLYAIKPEIGQGQSRSSKEVEAESVAYVVCQHYGIDNSDYSFGYVAGWSEGKALVELKASLGTIRDTAAEIVVGVDERLEIMMQINKELEKYSDQAIEIETNGEKKKSIKKKLENNKRNIRNRSERKEDPCVGAEI